MKTLLLIALAAAVIGLVMSVVIFYKLVFVKKNPPFAEQKNGLHEFYFMRSNK